jgi:hypothetical protein
VIALIILTLETTHFQSIESIFLGWLQWQNTCQKKKKKERKKKCWAPVAHAYNPSYSGGTDQEDHSLKPACANSSARPYLEKPFTKKGCWSGSR